MITDYIGREGSAETPKNDYVIYGWPLTSEYGTERRRTCEKHNTIESKEHFHISQPPLSPATNMSTQPEFSTKQRKTSKTRYKWIASTQSSYLSLSSINHSMAYILRSSYVDLIRPKKETILVWCLESRSKERLTASTRFFVSFCDCCRRLVGPISRNI